MSKTQMNYILRRLRWSMLENNNEWVSAGDMMLMLKQHTTSDVNELYRNSCDNKKIPVPNLRYLNNTNQLARRAIMSGQYEVMKHNNANMYRLEVTA